MYGAPDSNVSHLCNGGILLELELRGTEQPFEPWYLVLQNGEPIAKIWHSNQPAGSLWEFRDYFVASLSKMFFMDVEEKGLAAALQGVRATLIGAGQTMDFYDNGEGSSPEQDHDLLVKFGFLDKESTSLTPTLDLVLAKTSPDKAFYEVKVNGIVCAHIFCYDTLEASAKELFLSPLYRDTSLELFEQEGLEAALQLLNAVPRYGSDVMAALYRTDMTLAARSTLASRSNNPGKSKVNTANSLTVSQRTKLAQELTNSVLRMTDQEAATLAALMRLADRLILDGIAVLPDDIEAMVALLKRRREAPLQDGRRQAAKIRILDPGYIVDPEPEQESIEIEPYSGARP
jgi:hypothetical protein